MSAFAAPPPSNATKRSTTIDICRALLFILMMNTHALTIAGIPKHHWLLSDCWLPNGWATAAFVVLSGFGVGYIYAGRPADGARDRAIRRRALEIILVMFGSNIFSPPSGKPLVAPPVRLPHRAGGSVS